MIFGKKVLSIYEVYLKELIKYTLIFVQTSKVTKNDSNNDKFCFTRSNTAGKFKVPKNKNNTQKISRTDFRLYTVFS